ncbi:MAG: hypothetical protein QUS14_07405 [Pyrinomonadaceae bacterium]|nr:hypothetical protein [Pyrinomonadaceae bacterium]
MADSKRQRLVDAIKARMQTILTANGYATNIGQNVHDWRVHFQEDELPAVTICDLPADAAETAGRSNPQETIWLMPVQIRVYAAKDTDPSNIREMLKDIQAAIRTDDRWKVSNVGLAMITRPLREGPLVHEESFEVIGGVVEMQIQFITQKFNAEA